MEDFLKTFVLPIVLAIITFIGGRKSVSNRRNDDYTSIITELNALKNFRDLLVTDNNSLIEELRKMKKEMNELKDEIGKMKHCNNIGCINRS